MPKNKLAFTIGDWVEVSGLIKITKTSLKPAGFGFRMKRETARCDCTPFVAQVCGARYVYDGVTEYNGEDGSSFTSSKSRLVYLVRRGMKNKSIDVDPLDLKLLAPQPTDRKLPPIFHEYAYKWTKQDIEDMSKAAKDAPRDKKGRFVHMTGGVVV